MGLTGDARGIGGEEEGELTGATRSGWWCGCSGDGGVDGAASGPPATRAAGRWRVGLATGVGRARSTASAPSSSSFSVGKAAGRRRRERRGRRRGVSRRRGGVAASGRRRGGGAAASGEERRGEGDRGRGREGDRGPGRKNMDGGTILMAHHPPVRHKYIHTNGAPHPGAPLVLFFYFCSSQQVISHLT